MFQVSVSSTESVYVREMNNAAIAQITSVRAAADNEEQQSAAAKHRRLRPLPRPLSVSDPPAGGTRHFSL